MNPADLTPKDRVFLRYAGGVGVLVAYPAVVAAYQSLRARGYVALLDTFGAHHHFKTAMGVDALVQEEEAEA